MAKIEARLAYFKAVSGQLSKIKTTVYKMVSTKKEVCWNCNGKGTHVNSSIDGHYITEEEWNLAGTEFQENYMSGVYDVQCDECKGLRVIDVVDEDQFSKEDLRAYREGLDDARDEAAEDYWTHQGETRGEG